MAAGRPGGSGAAQLRAWSQVSGFGRVRSSSRVPGSKNISVFSSIRIADLAAPEDLRGQHVPTGQVDSAVLADDPVDLDRGSRLGRGQGRRPGRPSSLGGQAVRSAADRWERTVLIRAAPMIKWMTSVPAQNVTVIPERSGPSQNWRRATCMFPLAGTTRSNSTGPPS